MTKNLLRPVLTALTASALCLTSCGSGAREIENLGSDTLLEVAGALAQKYGDLHPEIVVSVGSGGSGVGISSLIADEVDIANSSRPLKDDEVKAAKKRGVSPQEHVIGFDGIAVYVHKDNPIQSLTIEQLAAIFGEGGKIDSWKDLGLDFGSDEDNEIFLGSRQNSSGTYECFRETVLGEDGRFKQRCNNLNGSKDVVEFCAKTKGAIGYSGLAYATDDVRIVPVARAAGAPAILPTVATVQDKSYPIARPLFMFTNGEPKGDIGDYIAWIKSDDGQKVLSARGYVPLR